jgi:hypothetical protein
MNYPCPFEHAVYNPRKKNQRKKYPFCAAKMSEEVDVYLQPHFNLLEMIGKYVRNISAFLKFKLLEERTVKSGESIERKKGIMWR